MKVLLRLIDDYLYITTSYDDAKRFLKVMKKGTQKPGVCERTGELKEHRASGIWLLHLEGEDADEL